MKASFIRLSLFAAAMLVVSGCSATQHRAEVREDAIDRVSVGIVQREIRVGMPSAEVAGILGSPNIVSTDAERNEVWIWDKISSEVSYSRSSGVVAGLVIGSSGGGAGGGSKRAAFSATMSVFQDLGFIIDDGDFDTGLITATGPMRREQRDAGHLFAQFFAGIDTRIATQRRATAFVEKMPSGLVRIRLNFVGNMAMIQGTPHSAAVEDPASYQATFEQIDKAIFVSSATT